MPFPLPPSISPRARRGQRAAACVSICVGILWLRAGRTPARGLGSSGAPLRTPAPRSPQLPDPARTSRAPPRLPHRRAPRIRPAPGRMRRRLPGDRHRGGRVVPGADDRAPRGGHRHGPGRGGGRPEPPGRRDGPQHRRGPAGADPGDGPPGAGAAGPALVLGHRPRSRGAGAHARAAASMALARSRVRDHMGQCPVGRSTYSTGSRDSSLATGWPSAASSRIVAAGKLEQITVVGTS